MAYQTTRQIAHVQHVTLVQTHDVDPFISFIIFIIPYLNIMLVILVCILWCMYHMVWPKQLHELNQVFLFFFFLEEPTYCTPNF